MPYEKEGIKYPRCTQIISDCTDKSGALTQWGANCCVEWILENCIDIYSFFYDERCKCVTKDQLNQARFAYKTVSDKALDVGSEVHGLIEEYLNLSMTEDNFDYKKWMLKNIPENYNEQVVSAFNAFLSWKEEHNLKPIELEKTVYGSRWAGTLDFYGYFDDKLYVIDWKTSKPKNKKTGKGIYPENRYQVAAYRSVVDPIKRFLSSSRSSIKHPQGCGVLRLDKEKGTPDWVDTSNTYNSDLRVFNRMVDLYFERHPRVAKRFEGIIPF